MNNLGFRLFRGSIIVTVLLVCAILSGCGGSATDKQSKQPYFTSGSHEADQRAQQRIAQAQQARGKTSDKDDKDKDKGQKGPLFARLGGDQGIQQIVNDFVDRVLADPRVNWERKGITGGGFAGVGKHPVEWQASPDRVKRLKEHMSQFIAVATGGPAKYEGREMVEVHHNMKITNAEFDAAVGDLKSTMDKLGVATTEQRELLAIIESTREQVVESR
jgi:hemoglobin